MAHHTTTPNTTRKLRSGLATVVLSGCVLSVIAAPAAASAAPHSSHTAATRSTYTAAPAVSQAATHRIRQVGLGDSSDSYVSYAHPKLRPGHSRRLVAADSRHDRRVVYVKFHVGGMPKRATITKTDLVFTRSANSPASFLHLYRVNSTNWSQHRLDARNRPKGVHKLAVRHVGAAGRIVSFPVRMHLQAHHTYSFAVTSSSHRAETRFSSRESGIGPKMAIKISIPIKKQRQPSATPTPTPTPTTANPTPTPTSTTASPTPTESSTPTPTPTTSTPTPTPTPTSATPIPTASTATPTPTPTTASPTPTPTQSTATPTPTPTTATPTPTPTQSSGCSLSNKLVPSCGVLLGGWLTSYGGSTLDQKAANFNSQSGSKVDVVHDYRTPGQTLSAADATVAKTPGQILLLNWKPASVWADGNGGNASVNAQIDSMANSIKALGSTKILLTVFHEPENDVSSGASGCASTVYKGSAGTPADYRAMWANVESRFNALGVTNVVWTMNYMGFSGWNCMVDDLWPGNSLVDWILWDPYMSDNLTYTASVKAMYNELTTLSDATHDYLSKPWGLGEFGDRATTDANQETFYSSVAHTLDVSTFPKLKLLTFFDAVGTSGDYRVAYSPEKVWDDKEVGDLQNLSNDPSVVAGRASVAGG
jgi:hypothetical protein